METAKPKVLLWLMPYRGVSKNFFSYIHKRLPNGWVIKSYEINPSLVNTKMIPNKFGRFMVTSDNGLTGQLAADVHRIKPAAILCTDIVGLFAISGDKVETMEKYRGAITNYVSGDDFVPVLCMKSFQEYFLKPEEAFLLREDTAKLERFLTGKLKQHPAFQHIVVTAPTQREWLLEDMRNGVAAALDIETSGQVITCTGYGVLKKDGQIMTYVVPLMWPDAEYEEIEANIELMIAANAMPIPKVLQNGQYDMAYFHMFGAPISNYVIDTGMLMYSIYVEAPKRLDYLASICTDNYWYWKDDLKAAKEEGLPTTMDGWHMYWKYNAQDVYSTMLVAQDLAPVVASTPYALKNYWLTMRLQAYLAYPASMSGFRIDKKVQEALAKQGIEQANEARKRLTAMGIPEDFNPNSPANVAMLVYDVLQVPPKIVKGAAKKPTDKVTLAILAEQYPLLQEYLDAILAYKEPLNACAKYGPVGYMKNFNLSEKENGLIPFKGEFFMYAFNAMGTVTGRLASKKSNFWCGQQAQNIPNEFRKQFCSPHPDWIVAEFDFSSSDVWFVSYESEDPTYLADRANGVDAHLRSCSWIFGKKYEELAAGKAKGDKTVLAMRKASKAPGLGAMYAMGGDTLVSQMSIAGVREAAKLMGLTKIPMSYGDVVKFASEILERIHRKVQLRIWYDRIIRAAEANGSKVTTYGGFTRKFSGKLIDRELSAQYGQGGTAGNCNRAVAEIAKKLPDLRPALQVHDSLTFFCHKSNIDQLAEVVKIMSAPITVKNRTFSVPVEGKVGLRWGDDAMIKWHPDVTYEDILAAETSFLQGKSNG